MVVAGPDEPAPRPPRLAAAIRESASLAYEWAIPLLATNLAWAVVVAVYLVLLLGFPLLILAAPLLALPTSALMRLSVEAVRSGVPGLAMAWTEMRRRALRKVGLALVQLLVLGIAATNLGIATRIGGVVGLVTGGVALYAVVAGAMLAVTVWPVVCDPRRDGPLRGQLRLAAAVALRRPLQVGALAGLAAFAVYATLQLLVPAVFLPALVMLSVAAYVVPAADELRRAPPPNGTAGRG